MVLSVFLLAIIYRLYLWDSWPQPDLRLRTVNNELWNANYFKFLVVVVVVVVVVFLLLLHATLIDPHSAVLFRSNQKVRLVLGCRVYESLL